MKTEEVNKVLADALKALVNGYNFPPGDHLIVDARAALAIDSAARRKSAKAQAGVDVRESEPVQPATVPDGWNDAYAAFVGAVDTPQMRRMINNEYAEDARKRMRAINDAMLAASNPKGGN